MENKRYVTVFGATGKIGTALLHYLSQAEVPVIAVTRDSAKAFPLPFITWKTADMGTLSSLPATMENSSAVFLVSGMSINFIAEQGNVITAAKAAGVNHIVKLSSASAGKSSPPHIVESAIGSSHKAVEDLLRASGVDWTILQPTGFMQNWLGEFAQKIKDERRIYEATGDGKRAYIDLRDIAAVAFTVLQEPAKHAGQTYILTGDEALNYWQVATLISNVLQEEVTYVPLTIAAAKERMEQKGMPAWAVQTFLAYAEVQRNGDAAYVSGDVAAVLQQPARTAAGFFEEYAKWFK
ncbi:NmrA family NAD(P)-binding protein [Chitinophaga arvensicola]|uniref:Uncharacterized conserved protein YbjT, contains NAD(P)-binding and DUF2867 domains n=1 Tax=Chitinophaga arvensicola TaxID=29529 RepID=A0A1I0RFC2_9BACT|nr:NmrA family NAD(P)-binding protein [Chitinophaga arvensicola]SEW39605.1 Uncharacterized conserved protein YbjT, contains NAD(P)-binding and DUF2867 domains [Chitinophaga arvensicola]